MRKKERNEQRQRMESVFPCPFHKLKCAFHTHTAVVHTHTDMYARLDTLYVAVYRAQRGTQTPTMARAYKNSHQGAIVIGWKGKANGPQHTHTHTTSRRSRKRRHRHRHRRRLRLSERMRFSSHTAEALFGQITMHAAEVQRQAKQ